MRFLGGLFRVIFGVILLVGGAAVSFFIFPDETLAVYGGYVAMGLGAISVIAGVFKMIRGLLPF